MTDEQLERRHAQQREYYRAHREQRLAYNKVYQKERRELERRKLFSRTQNE